jgi:hypothetical protein
MDDSIVLAMDSSRSSRGSGKSKKDLRPCGVVARGVFDVISL